jgi:Transposase DDE domain
MLLERMVCVRHVCLRRLSQGCWATQMRFWRFMANARVTVDSLIEGWSDRTRDAAAGRHVLAIQDSSQIRFATTEENRRGLGKIKKGNCRGVVLHAMIGVDADEGTFLGLVGGRVWTRSDEIKRAKSERLLSEKESNRWLVTAEQAKDILAQARMITVVDDREGDIYAHWARTPGDNVHLLARMMQDHCVEKGGTLCKLARRTAFAAKAVVELRERANRRPRNAHVSMRFGSVLLKRPGNSLDKELPETVALSFVEAVELHPPKNVEPVSWMLLTTHEVRSVADAWQVIGWYKRRWIIEQFFRTMKTMGLKIEDSQLQSADRLIKIVAIAAKAAAIIIQLVQARDGHHPQPASLAFRPDEIDALDALNKKLQGKTELQKNPHREKTLAWAAWIIAKLGGWTGYASHRPPGPVTFHNGLHYFHAFTDGWAFKNV